MKNFLIFILLICFYNNHSICSETEEFLTMIPLEDVEIFSELIHNHEPNVLNADCELCNRQSQRGPTLLSASIKTGNQAHCCLNTLKCITCITPAKLLITYCGFCCWSYSKGE